MQASQFRRFRQNPLVSSNRQVTTTPFSQNTVFATSIFHLSRDPFPDLLSPAVWDFLDLLFSLFRECLAFWGRFLFIPKDCMGLSRDGQTLPFGWFSFVLEKQ